MVNNLFDNIEERQEIMNIALFLKDFCSEMQEYMAILKVLEGLKNQLSQNDFIAETKRAVEQQLLLEFVKVFDKPNFNKEENCSVKSRSLSTVISYLWEEQVCKKNLM